MLGNTQRRTYIERLRNDPRTRAMQQGWASQATYEAEQRYPHPDQDMARAHFAAERAIQLAMSFVLDNDGELAALREQLEQVLATRLEFARLSPQPIIVKTDGGA